MNKLLKYSTRFFALLFVLSGCNDYLKEDSGDLLIPNKVEDFANMLYAEGYPSEFNDDVAWFKLMTDDIEMGQLEIDPYDDDSYKSYDLFDSYEGGEGRQAYVWSQDIELKIKDNFWANRYANILACNTVIDALPTMAIEGDSAKFNYLAAQAYGLRAFNYWCLINSYALPYSSSNLDKPGVIIRTTPQIDVSDRARSSIRDVYELINKDIEKAEQYIKGCPVPDNKHLLSEPAILFLASRIALFQENWTEVIRSGEEFMKQVSTVFDLNSVDETTFGAEIASESFYIMNGYVNKEIVFTFGNNNTYYKYMSDETSGHIYGLGFRPSHQGGNSLLESYEEGDLRRKAYFMQDLPQTEEYDWWEDAYITYPGTHFYAYPSKYRQAYDPAATKPSEKTKRENWRSVEVLLNLAEAYVRSSNSVDAKALDLLNTLRRNRFASSAFVEKTTADFNNADALLKFIWDERRRELCFEEAMRFWDLRRQGMPQIVHKWYNSWETYETYTLNQGSPNYVLSIPDSETNYNDACVNNNREIITAQ